MEFDHRPREIEAVFEMAKSRDAQILWLVRCLLLNRCQADMVTIEATLALLLQLPRRLPLVNVEIHDVKPARPDERLERFWGEHVDMVDLYSGRNAPATPDLIPKILDCENQQPARSERGVRSLDKAARVKE